MKNILYLIIGAVLFLTSCQKYLDIKSNSKEVLITTAAQCQQLLDNTGASYGQPQMNLSFPNDQEISSDDYYLTYDNFTQQGAEDQNTYTWFKGAIHPDASNEWTYTYSVAENANLVMESLAKINDGTPKSTLDMIKGEALFFRAYAFMQIAQSYCKPYISSSASADPGIPIRLTSDINEVSVRGTVQQTYDQIINDLTTAAPLLPNTALFPTRPSKGAAYAMLARVYLAMSDYKDAQTSATNALAINNQLTDFNTLDQGTDTPFPLFIPDEYFLSTTWGNYLTSSYYAFIDSNIVRSYDPNDLRSRIYLKSYGDGYYFSGNYYPNNNAQLFSGLAVDEVYLTRAECYARAGDITNAMKDLNTLLKTRWVTGTYVNMTASTATEALNLVLTERRKELIMRNTRWTDLRRLNLDPATAVTLTRILDGVTYTLPPNDLRYTLLIPQSVIINSKIEQNPR